MDNKDDGHHLFPPHGFIYISFFCLSQRRQSDVPVPGELCLQSYRRTCEKFGDQESVVISDYKWNNVQGAKFCNRPDDNVVINNWIRLWWLSHTPDSVSFIVVFVYSVVSLGFIDMSNIITIFSATTDSQFKWHSVIKRHKVIIWNDDQIKGTFLPVPMHHFWNPRVLYFPQKFNS